MKECRRVKRLLSCYLDNEINSSDAALVKEHLDSCFLCRNELSELAKVTKIIYAKERKTLPEDYLVCRLREAVRSNQYAQRAFSWLSAMGNFSRQLIPVPVTVMALAVALLLLTPGQYISAPSLEDNMLSGTKITIDNALGLILGAEE